MERTYTVTSMKVSPDYAGFKDAIISLSFIYGNANASLSGDVKLQRPSGNFVPLNEVSKETALQWLLEQCPNSTDEFNVQLDLQTKRKTDASYVYTWPGEDDEAQ